MKNIFSRFSHLKDWFLRKSLKIKFVILVVVLILGWIVYSRFKSGNATVKYQTGNVVRESIIKSVTESGNVTSTSQTNIGSLTNGVITEVYVKNGDQVKAGQNLFKVKSTATPQEQAQAYASYLSSQASLNAAKSKMDSLQSALFKANQAFMNDRGVANPTDQQKQDPKYIEENADWLQAEADYNNQSVTINAAQASFNNASLTYASTQDSVVTAPIDGTVANFSLVVGSNVTASGTTYNNSNTSSSSSSSSSTTPVLVLGNFSNLSIKAPVSEVDISQLQKGQKATITLDAYPDATYVGKVDSVDTIGTNSSGVVTYNVYIVFVSPPPTIHPGMTASAVIQIDRKDDVLGVPTSAVQTGANGSYVRELKNGAVVQVPVEVGIASDTDTEIISGLSEGESIITSISTPTTTTSTGASPFSALGGRGFGGGGGAVRVTTGGR